MGLLNETQSENISKCVTSRTRTCNEDAGCSSPMLEYGDCSQEQICQWSSNGLKCSTESIS